MIDGIKTGDLSLNTHPLANKLNIDVTPQTVYTNIRGLILGFIDKVDVSTGEIRKMCNLRGSVHKYANRGAHNADSFRMSDLCRVLTELRDEYAINPDITRLYSVEFGVNIKLPYDPRRVLNAIRMYKGKTFTPMGKIGLVYQTKEHRLKIYDKGRQCGVPGFDNVLRIEGKAIVSYLRRKGIYTPTLGNLLNADLWKQFETILLEMVDDTIIVEAVQPDTLTKKERELFTLFTGDGWQALNRNVLHKKKKQFAELAARTGASSIKEEIKHLIVAECALLRDMEQESGDKSDVFAETKKPKETNKINKQTGIKYAKQATNRIFFRDAQKGCFGDKSAAWIKGIFIATTTPPIATAVAVHDPPQCTAKLSHTAPHEVRARGKPPDASELIKVEASEV